MRKKNIGGRARKITKSLAEWDEELERAELIAFQMGVEHAERVARPEFNSCPMCALQRERDALEARLRILESSSRRRPRWHQ